MPDLGDSEPVGAPDALRKALIGRLVFYESLLQGGAWYTHPTPVCVTDVTSESISVADPEWQRPLVFRAGECWGGGTYRIRSKDLGNLLVDGSYFQLGKARREEWDICGELTGMEEG